MVAEHLAFHESLIAAAQDHHDPGALELVVDGYLQHGRQAGFHSGRIGKLVEHEDKPPPLLLGLSRHIGERIIPGPECAAVFGLAKEPASLR